MKADKDDKNLTDKADKKKATNNLK